MKFFLCIAFFSLNLTLFCQVTHEDSVNYQFSLKMNSSIGVDLKGEKMPLFVAKDKNGKLFSNDDLQSRITFINFWFESCQPCIAEFNALEKFYNRNKQRAGFQFISITFEQDTTIEKVRKKYNLTYPIYYLSYDSCKIVKFNRGYPTNIIVGRNRNILYALTGGSADPDEANKEVNYFIQAELDKHLKLPVIKAYER